jgi:hypothetical protein
MARDASGLSIVNLDGSFGSNLGELNIIEVDVVASSMDDCENKSRVRYLPMKPNILIQG